MPTVRKVNAAIDNVRHFNPARMVKGMPAPQKNRHHAGKINLQYEVDSASRATKLYHRRKSLFKKVYIFLWKHTRHLQIFKVTHYDLHSFVSKSTKENHIASCWLFLFNVIEILQLDTNWTQFDLTICFTLCHGIQVNLPIFPRGVMKVHKFWR